MVPTAIRKNHIIPLISSISDYLVNKEIQTLVSNINVIPQHTPIIIENVTQ